MKIRTKMENLLAAFSICLNIYKSYWSEDKWNSGPTYKHFSCSKCKSKSANSLIWRYMTIRTNMKTHSAALHGTLSANWLIWRNMKIRTNMETCSAALNGTLNLPLNQSPKIVIVMGLNHNHRAAKAKSHIQIKLDVSGCG